MLPGMQKAPTINLSGREEALFHFALEQRDPGVLPADSPRWVFLQWLVGQGYLLHCSSS